MTVLTGVSADILNRGVEAGLFNGLACRVGDDWYYSIDVVPLVAWSDQLAEDVVAGRLSDAKAKKALWTRAAQLRQRTADLNARLTAK